MNVIRITAEKLLEKANSYKRMTVGVERVKYKTMTDVLVGLAVALNDIADSIEDDIDKKESDNINNLVNKILGDNVFGEIVDAKINQTVNRRFGSLVPRKKPKQSTKPKK